MGSSTDAAVEALVDDLNDAQRQAVTHTDGPLLILAGPGSGKTRVVTRRAAYLAQTVALPRQILAITFTNKAALEMRERIESLLAPAGMTVCTFHALCAQLIRIHHEAVGVPANYSILDRDDRRKVLKAAVGLAGLSTTNFPPARVERHISNAKAAMLTPTGFEGIAQNYQDEQIARVYHAYAHLTAEMGALDFDDLLMRIAHLLDAEPDIACAIQDRYRYILIDEYQDTNTPQYIIANALAQTHRNICATGDPDQSIYGWRGADIGNILRFEEDYPESVVVRLEQNYRSTKRILQAADALIAHNVSRKEKSLWTEHEEGPAVRFIEAETSEEEADAVARRIAQQIQNGISPSEIAVFYRINALSRSIEEALIREGIRYQVARGLEFYNRKEIKDVLAYPRVLVNPADSVSLLRIINTPARGIGGTTVQRLLDLAQTRGIPLFDLITGDEDLSSVGRSASKVKAFGALLAQLVHVMEQPPEHALDAIVSQSGLRAHYATLSEVEADVRPVDNINELLNAAVEFRRQFPGASMLDWLQHTALLGDVDGLHDEAGRVTLMTIHAAKGLEFQAVHIVGLEESLLPFEREDDGNGRDLEEERRLLFVGITRAKRELSLSRARYRMLRGRSDRTTVSRFAAELATTGLEQSTLTSKRSPRRRAAPSGELPSDIELWEVGTLVRHPVHGLGQVMQFRRGARRTQVDVQFQNGLRRAWMLEFAQLERVEYDEVE